MSLTALERFAYPSETFVRCFTQEFAPGIRIGFKGLPGTNTLAYYKHSKTTAIKSFITWTPGGQRNIETETTSNKN